MSDEELRMEAYYYGFDKTECRPVDKILSAVACAGKAFHSTYCWSDDCTWPGHTGDTPIEWMQNAADECADEITKLREALKAAREVLKKHADLITDDDYDAVTAQIDKALGGKNENA